MDNFRNHMPNGEDEATIISNIQVSSQLGRKTGSLKTIGPLTSARKLGQGKVGIFPNVGNGNLYIEDYQSEIIDGDFKRKLGFCYNSQGSPAWKVNIGRRLGFVNDRYVLILDDGSQVQFTAVDDTHFVASSSLGKFELTLNPDNTVTIFHPGDGKTSAFNLAGYETSRVDRSGVGIKFKYDRDNSISQITLPSQRTIKWNKKLNLDGTTSIDTTLCASDGTIQRHLMRHLFTGKQLTETSVAIDSSNIYEIKYGYTGNNLSSVSQTDNTTASFTYDTFQGNTVISDVTDGEGRMSHFEYETGQRTWQQADDPDSLTTFSVDDNDRLLTVSKPRLQIVPGKAPSAIQKKTSYTHSGENLASVVYDSGSNKTFKYDPKTGLRSELGDSIGTQEQTFFDQSSGFKVAFKTSANEAGVIRDIYEFYVYDDKFRLRYKISSDGTVSQTTWDDTFNIITCVRRQTGAQIDTSTFSETVLPKLADVDSWWQTQDITKSTLELTDYNDFGQKIQNTKFAHVDSTGRGIETDAMRQTTYGNLLPTGEWQSRTKRQSSNKSGTDLRSFDGLCRLTSKTDTLSRITTIKYDDAHQIAVHTLPSGLSVISTSDKSGLLIQKVATDGSIRLTTTFERDSKRGGIIKFTTPTNTFTIINDPSGRFCSSTDSADLLFIAEYDDRDNPTTTTKLDPASSKPPKIETVLKDIAGNIRYIIDGDGYVHERIYDHAHNHLVTIKYKMPLDPSVKRVLTPDGNLKGITKSTLDTEDRRTYYFVNADGHRIGMQDFGGYITAYIRDANGRLQFEDKYKTPQARPTTWSDAQASVAKSKFDRTAFIRDLLGNIESEINPESLRAVAQSNGLDIDHLSLDDLIPILALFKSAQTDDSPGGIMTFRDWLGNGKWSNEIIKNIDPTKPDHGESRDFDTENRLRDHEKHLEQSRRHYEYDEHDDVCDELVIDLSTGNVAREVKTNRDTFGNEQSSSGPRENQKTSHVYEQSTGLLAQTIDSENNIIITYKDIYRRTVAEVDQSGYITRFQYDGYNTAWLTKRRVMTSVNPGDRETLQGGLLTPDVDTTLRSYENDAIDQIEEQDFDHRGNETTSSIGGKYKTKCETDAFGTEVKVSKDNGDGTQDVEITAIKPFPNGNSGIERDSTRDPSGLNILTTESLNHQHLPGRVIDELKNQHDYTYDSQKSRLTHKDAALGATESWTHDHLGRETSHADFLGNTSTVDFDDPNRKRTYKSAAGTTHSIQKSALGMDEEFIDPASNISKKSHTPAGEVVSETDEEGNETTHAISAMGYHTGTTFPGGLEHHQQLNEIGHVQAQLQLADGKVLTDAFNPDATGAPSLHVDADNHSHHKTHDLSGDVISESTDLADGRYTHDISRNGMGFTTANTYQDEEQTFVVITKRDVLNRNTGSVKDPKSADNPNGLNIEDSLTLDAKGNTRIHTNPLGKNTWLIRDTAGRIKFKISALGIVTAYKHNAMRHIYSCRYRNQIPTASLSATTTPDDISKLIGDNTAESETYYFHNGDGDLIYEITGLGFVTEYLYDRARRPQGQYHYSKPIDTKHNLIKGDLSSVAPLVNKNIDPANDRKHIEVYNKAGKLRFKINRRGQITEHVLNDAYNPVTVIKYDTLLDFTKPPIDWEEDTIAAYLADKTSPKDRVKHQIFDQRNCLRFVIDEAGYVIEYKYDGRGNEVDAYIYPTQLNTLPATLNLATLIAITTPFRNDLKTRHINTTWDGLNRKSQKQDHDAIEIWKHNALGHIKEYIDQEQFIWSTAFDNAGRKSHTVTPETDVYTVEKDPDNPGKIRLATPGPVRDKLVDTFVRDASGNLVLLVKSALSDTQLSNARQSSQTFDDDGRCTSGYVENASVDNPAVDPTKPGDSVTTKQKVQKNYVFNNADKKLVEVDESGDAHFFIYDADQRLIYEISTEGNIRHYERNAFGEVIKLTQYATRCTLDLTTAAYRQNGITQSQIEAPNVLKTSDDDRTIEFEYNQNGVRIITKLDPQLLAWIEEVEAKDKKDKKEGVIKWSFDIGPITRFTLNSFDEKTSEQKLVHGGTTPEWSNEQTWRDKRGTPVVIAKSVDGTSGKYVVTVHQPDYQKEYILTHKIAVPVDQSQLFDAQSEPLDPVVVLQNLEALYDETEDKITEYERDALTVAIKTIVKQELVHATSTQPNGKTGPLTSARADLVTEVASYDKRNLKPTKTISPKRAVSTTNYDELQREAGRQGPPVDLSTDNSLPRAASKTLKGYNAFDSHPVVEQSTFLTEPSPGAEYDPSPAPIHMTLRLSNERGIVEIEQNPNGVPFYKTFQANKRPARNFHFMSVQVPKSEGSTEFSEVLRPSQEKYSYTGRNMTYTCIIETDGTERPVHILFNAFNESIAHGPDGKTWPQITIPSASGNPLFLMGSDGIPRVKLHNGLGSQVAEIKSPTKSLTESIALAADGSVNTAKAAQTNIESLLQHLEDKDDFANYQRILHATNHLKRVIKRYQPKRTIQNPKTPEPFYTSFEIGSDYPVLGKVSISWPAPQDEFFLGDGNRSYLQLTLSGTEGDGIKLPITCSADGTRHGVDVSGLSTDYYDYVLRYYYNPKVTGIGPDHGSNTSHTYEAIGNALPVITPKTADSQSVVARIFNYNQLQLAGHFASTPTTVDIIQNGAVHTLPLKPVAGVDNSFTCDLSGLATGDYQIRVNDNLLQDIYTIVTKTLPSDLCAVEVVVPQIDFNASLKMSTHHKQHNELLWDALINGECQMPSRHPWLTDDCQPKAKISYTGKAASGSFVAEFDTNKQLGDPGSHLDSSSTNDSEIYEALLFNELTLSTTLQGEDVTLMSGPPVLGFANQKTPFHNTDNEDHLHHYTWQQSCRYQGNSLVFTGLPDNVDSYSIEFFDYTVTKRGIWWDLYDQGYLTPSKKHLIVDVSGIGPGKFDFHVVFYDADKNPIQTLDKNIPITHGKDAIPTGPQKHHYLTVQPAESQEHNAFGVTSHTNALGETWYYYKNKRGYRVKTVTPPYATLNPDNSKADPAPHEREKGYDADGHHIADSDENGHVTAYTVNDAGDKLATLYPDGVLERYVLDGFRRAIVVRGADGILEQRSFDALDNLVKLTNAAGEAHLFERNEQEQVKRETTAAARVRHANHYRKNDTMEQYNACGQARKVKYDGNRKPLEINDGIALPMQYVRDFFGNLDVSQPYQIRDKGGAQIKLTMDHNKCVLTRKSSGGDHGTWLNPVTGDYEPTPDQDLEFIHDEAGNVIYILDQAMNTRTLQHYDVTDACIAERFINSDGRVVQDTQVVLNAVGWLVQVFDDVMQAEYEYDAKGNRRHTIVRIKPDNTFVLLNVEDWFTYNEADRVEYDGCAMVQGKVDVSFDPTTNKPKGRLVLYDKDGKPVQEIYQDEKSAKAKIISYNARNQVIATDTADYNRDTGATSNPQPESRFSPDADGVRQGYTAFDHKKKVSNTSTVQGQDGEGRMLRMQNQQNKLDTGEAVESDHKDPNTNVITIDGTPDIDGNTSGHKVYSPSDGDKWVTREEYTDKFADSDHRELSTVSAVEYGNPKKQMPKGPTDPVVVTTGISPNGNISSRDGQSASDDGFRLFWTNPQNRIVLVQNGKSYKAGADFEYYFYDPRTGTPIGRFGNVPPVGVTPVNEADIQSYNDVDFNLNFHQIGKYYPPEAPGQYTVIAPQTYFDISTIVYGDARYGTELATANGGGSGSDIANPGTIQVPPLATMMYNNQAQRPTYSSQAIIGSLDPEMPRLMPDTHHERLAQVLDAIIAVFAAIAGAFTGGATWLACIEQFVLAIAANVATQGVNLAEGVESKFSFKSLGLSAVNAAFGPGDSDVGTGAAQFFETLAINEAMTLVEQGVECALHLQPHLQWSAFVAAGLNTALAKVKAEGINDDLFAVVSGADAALEATLYGLDSKDHRINPLAVASSALGATLAQLCANATAQAKAQQDKDPSANPKTPFDTDGLTPGEMAKARSDDYKSSDTIVIQQGNRASNDSSLAYMHAKQVNAAQLPSDLDPTTLAHQLAHFLWAHKNGIIEGGELLMFLASGGKPSANASSSGLIFPKMDARGNLTGWETEAEIKSHNEAHESGFDRFMDRHSTLSDFWQRTRCTANNLEDFVLNSPYGGLEHAGEAALAGLGTLIAKTGVLSKLGVFAGKVFVGGVGKATKLKSEALKELYDEAKQLGVEIRTGREADEILDHAAKMEGVPPESMHAVTIGDDLIFVRDTHFNDVRVLREELLHTQQQKPGFSISKESQMRAEIEVRQKMLENGTSWGLSNNELLEIEKEITIIRQRGSY